MIQQPCIIQAERTMSIWDILISKAKVGSYKLDYLVNGLCAFHVLCMQT